MDHLEALDPQSLSNKIWETQVPENFNPSLFAKFNGCNDPYEHVASIITQMAIIRVPNSSESRLLPDRFMDATMRWYMGLPRASNTNY